MRRARGVIWGSGFGIRKPTNPRSRITANPESQIPNHSPLRYHLRVTLKLRRLPHADDLPLPTYMTAGAAGMDLHAAVNDDLRLEPGAIALVPTGFEVAIPDGYEGQVRPRSGLAVKHGISLPNTPATIDADYRGEIRVPLINLGREAFVVSRGMRIAQLVIAPVVRVAWEEVEELPATVRAAGGFGHSGV